MIGQTVSHYRIEERLGAGSMGVVYRAEDLRLKRPVALKFLPPHLVADTRARDRFLVEAQAASALDHPNICVIHEIGEAEGGELFIAMAYYDGVTLARMLRRGPLPTQDALELARQVAQGLSMAHAHGLVHRDIKPANLKLTENGVWKILDFGIAKLAGATHLTRTGGVVGTLPYASPEQAGNDLVSAQSDIWSLGVVLYEALAGHLPFRGKTPVGTLYQILHEEPEPLVQIREDVSTDLSRLVGRALTKDLGIRYAGMDELLVDLDRLCDVVPVGGSAELVGAKGPSERELVSTPPFLSPVVEASGDSVHQPFVGREPEMEVLKGWLREALAGRGRVGFITGDAGSGKTSLARAFCRWAAGSNDHLVVATGNCNAHTGIGDPHRPFREILGELTGDVEAQWAAGSVTADHATRLWSLVPCTAAALIECGADLVGTFLSEAALLARAEAHPLLTGSELEDLRTLVQHQSRAGSIGQADLFEQYVRVLRTLAADQPLLMVVDDLQWADTGSTGLLFELGHHLAGSRILVLGLYRTAEVALGRKGERHPLEPVVHELAEIYGDVVLELGATADRGFVDALIDAEPNRLSIRFRKALLHQTAGHALFTVELVTALKQQGLLRRDEADRWVADERSIDWSRMPARVDAVIGERLGRLAPELQQLLTVASVEGERFTLEAVAQVQGVDARHLLAAVNQDLEKRHRLVVAEGLQRLNGQRLSVYRFRHILFQRHLYDRLNEVERAHLHEQMGEALEALHGEHANEIALQLGHHFQEAGLMEKAADYLASAGEQGERSLAPAEALAAYESARKAVMTLAPSEDRDRRELPVQLAIGRIRLGLPAPGYVEAYARAVELAEGVGSPEQLFWANAGVFWIDHYAGAWNRTEAVAQRLLSLAREAGNPILLVHALLFAGLDSKMRGIRGPSANYYQELISFYDPAEHWSPMFYGVDAGPYARSLLGLIRWESGYPGQAAALFEEAAELARQAEDPVTLHVVLFRDILIHMWGGDIHTARAKCEESSAAMVEGGQGGIVGSAQLTCQGWCDVLLGRIDAGVASMEQGLKDWEGAGNLVFTAYMRALLARGLALAGRATEGLRVLEEVMKDPRKNDPSNQSEVHRHLGRVYLALPHPDAAAAESAYRSAIETARDQDVRSYELRATTDLARLLQSQDRLEEARQMLGGIYGWFTEGHEWPYLIEARELLEELGGWR